MKIVPASIEEQINRVDRQRSLYIGLSAGAVALWSAFRLIWALYIGHDIWLALGVDGLPAGAVGRDRCGLGGRGRRIPDPVRQGILTRA